MNGEHVLVVSPDERWLRVLEVTLRLGGFAPITRRSVAEALRLRADDSAAAAIVLDLGPDSTAREVEATRTVLGESNLPAVVILPERLGAQQDAFRATGATVLVRPYAPSALYAALRPRTPAIGAEAAGSSQTGPAGA